MIRERKDNEVAPHIVGSVRAQKHLRSNAIAKVPLKGTASTDPWTKPGQDPWFHFKSSSSSQTGAAPSKRYDAITSKLTEDLKQTLDVKMQDTGAASSAQDARIHRLESDMAEIKSHQQTMHGWFQETGAKMAKQDEQIGQLHSTMQQQQQEIASTRAEVRASSETLQQHMGTAIGQVKSEIATEFQSVHSMMAAHMERLEHMMAENKRHCPGTE